MLRLNQKSVIEKLPTDENSYTVNLEGVFFKDLVGSEHLPAGEYELVYMLGSKESSEFIRFTVRE